MLLTRQQLIERLITGGVPTDAWAGAFNSIQGITFSTVSRAWVESVFSAGVDALRLNAPSLVTMRDIGGGKSRAVPRYFLNGFCCRGHSLFLYAHGMTGFALQASATPGGLDHDALAFGFLHYTAQPNAENLGRNGRHEILWFVDNEGVFQTFEGGDGEENELTPAELASITFLFAQ